MVYNTLFRYLSIKENVVLTMIWLRSYTVKMLLLNILPFFMISNFLLWDEWQKLYIYLVFSCNSTLIWKICRIIYLINIKISIDLVKSINHHFHSESIISDGVSILISERFNTTFTLDTIYSDLTIISIIKSVENKLAQCIFRIPW